MVYNLESYRKCQNGTTKEPMGRDQEQYRGCPVSAYGREASLRNRDLESCKCAPFMAVERLEGTLG